MHGFGFVRGIRVGNPTQRERGIDVLLYDAVESPGLRSWA